MSKTVTYSLLLASLLAAAGASAQRGGGRGAYIGCLYPAGGRQGTTFNVTVSGQGLRNPQFGFVSGSGVQVKVIGYEGPLGPLNKAQQDVLQRRLREIARTRFGRNLPGDKPADPNTPPSTTTLPDLPELRNLEQKTPRELKMVADRFLNINKRPKPPLAETVFLEVTTDKSAAPGDRELRVCGGAGLSNPVRFQVGALPEYLEQEAEEREPESIPTLELPVVLNGHIMPGDVDRYRLRLRRGQHLVIEAAARRLIPYLADAVPGWFQALLSLKDPAGKEIASADHYRYDQDPVLLVEVPQDGEYLLEVRDSIYRGRLDFVYRVSAGELPFITSLFPLGGPAGAPLTAAVTGCNLPFTTVKLDTQPGAQALRQVSFPAGETITNTVGYQVGELPEVTEAEPNNTPATGQAVKLPQVINGRISRDDDVDVYRVEGRAGEELVAEVCARRLGSPLDSLLRLTDAKGAVVAWNDDRPEQETGLQTHHADSYLTAKLPAAGVYYLSLSDTSRHGGDDYAYRLRVSAPQPDFALRVTPSSLNVPPGRVCLIEVYALRKDGFTGPIDLSLKDPPPALASGLKLAGARLPAGCDHLRLTLSLPAQRVDAPLPLQLQGTAQIGGRAVTRVAVPADDMMQAFAYRHLVPAQALLVAPYAAGFRAARNPGYQLPAEPVRLVTGTETLVPIRTAGGAALPEALQLTLSDPPPGLTLKEVRKVPEGLALVLQAEAGKPAPGYADNLIVEVAAQVEGRGPDGKATGRKQRYSLGYLPAVPFEVVRGGK